MKKTIQSVENGDNNEEIKMTCSKLLKGNLYSYFPLFLLYITSLNPFPPDYPLGV